MNVTKNAKKLEDNWKQLPPVYATNPKGIRLINQVISQEKSKENHNNFATKVNEKWNEFNKKFNQFLNNFQTIFNRKVAQIHNFFITKVQI